MYVAPTSETVSMVNAWLAENELSATSISPAGDWLSVSMPVSKARTMLSADFSVFTHAASGQQTTRTLAYSIPTALQGRIELIHPTVAFPNPLARRAFMSGTPAASKRAAGNVPASCAGAITPACLQALYGIPTTMATQSTNKLGVSGFANMFANKADLKVRLLSRLHALFDPGDLTHTLIDVLIHLSP